MATPKKRPVKAAISVPIPLQYWFGNHDNVEGLRNVLSDPAFNLACAIIKAQAMPTSAGISNADDHQLAINHAYLAGFCDFIDSLSRLTVLPAERLDIDEWGYVQPDSYNTNI